MFYNSTRIRARKVRERVVLKSFLGCLCFHDLCQVYIQKGHSGSEIINKITKTTSQNMGIQSIQ